MKSVPVHSAVRTLIDAKGDSFVPTNELNMFVRENAQKIPVLFRTYGNELGAQFLDRIFEIFPKNQVRFLVTAKGTYGQVVQKPNADMPFSFTADKSEFVEGGADLWPNAIEFIETYYRRNPHLLDDSTAELEVQTDTFVGGSDEE